VQKRLATAQAQERLEGGLDIHARRHAIIMPSRAIAQLDGNALAVGRDIPALGQAGPVLAFPTLKQRLIDKIAHNTVYDLQVILQWIEVGRLSLQVNVERPTIGIGTGGFCGNFGQLGSA
jgi:hypothetical protein